MNHVHTLPCVLDCLSCPWWDTVYWHRADKKFSKTVYLFFKSPCTSSPVLKLIIQCKQDSGKREEMAFGTNSFADIYSNL